MLYAVALSLQPPVGGGRRRPSGIERSIGDPFLRQFRPSNGQISRAHSDSLRETRAGVRFRDRASRIIPRHARSGSLHGRKVVTVSTPSQARSPSTRSELTMISRMAHFIFADSDAGRFVALIAISGASENRRRACVAATFSANVGRETECCHRLRAETTSRGALLGDSRRRNCGENRSRSGFQRGNHRDVALFCRTSPVTFRFLRVKGGVGDLSPERNGCLDQETRSRPERSTGFRLLIAPGGSRSGHPGSAVPVEAAT